MPVNEKEFNDLLVRYRPYVIRQVIRCGGGEDTEDYVQDVMEQVCRLRASFDPDKGAFTSWLWWQIRSCMQQRRVHRNKRSHVNYSMEYHTNGEPLSEVVTDPNQHASVELSETLAAISGLKPRQAHAVLQHALGATFSEIGKAYGATGQYAQSLQVEGLKILRRRLNNRPVMAGAL